MRKKNNDITRSSIKNFEEKEKSFNFEATAINQIKNITQEKKINQILKLILKQMKIVL